MMASKKAERVPSEQPLVLLADDHHDTLDMYAGFFNANGFRTVTATDGLAAFNLAKRLHPALIVLDIHMPTLDGIGALKLMRQHPPVQHTPILVLTAFDFHETDALAAGATAVCVKPCAPDKLLAEVRKLLAHAQK